MAEEGNQTFWTRTSETEGVGTATSAVMGCFAVTALRVQDPRAFGYWMIGYWRRVRTVWVIDGRNGGGMELRSVEESRRCACGGGRRIEDEGTPRGG